MAKISGRDNTKLVIVTTQQGRIPVYIYSQFHNEKNISVIPHTISVQINDSSYYVIMNVIVNEAMREQQRDRNYADLLIFKSQCDLVNSLTETKSFIQYT